MNLHENKKLFRQAVQTTAQQKGIPEIYIEKDYWVTHALYTIFTDPLGADAIFKGGTALSKCYKLIDRFSEDIDLTVLRKDGESDAQMKIKIRELGKVLTAQLPEVEIGGVTNKKGNIRKTAHTYEKEFQGAYGQIRDVIVLEITWLGNFEPYESKFVRTYISEMMESTDQGAFIDQYGLRPFEVKVLHPRRTLCEKIMSLVRFSYSDDAINDLKKKIRHVYDIHQLLQNKKLNSFFQSGDFEEMLIKVAEDDKTSYKSNNQWLKNHPKDAMIFKDLEDIWNGLSETYNGDFKNLVHGDLPNFLDVLATMKMVKEKIGSIGWPIKVEKI